MEGGTCQEEHEQRPPAKPGQVGYLHADKLATLFNRKGHEPRAGLRALRACNITRPGKSRVGVSTRSSASRSVGENGQRKQRHGPYDHSTRRKIEYGGSREPDCVS